MFRHYRVILRELVINVPSLSVYGARHTHTLTDTQYIPGQHDSSMNIKTVYTATTQTDLMRNSSNKKILAYIIVNK